MEYLRYELSCDALCLGERLRAGLFRPCAPVWAYSTIVGALAAVFGDGEHIHAFGRFLPSDGRSNHREILTFAPRDRADGTSVLPLQVEYIVNVRAEVFVVRNRVVDCWPDAFSLRVGAMKSKGFGACRLHRTGLVNDGTLQRGELVCRLPEDRAEAVGIRRIISRRLGYLFRPTSEHSGVWVRSLFEGSQVVAPAPLVQ